MKKIFAIYIFVFLITGLPVFAENEDIESGVENLMKYTDSVENAFVGQKKITDEDFQTTLAKVKSKRDKKKKINQPFKGKGYNEENNGEYIDETAAKNLLLGLSVDLINGDGTEIPVGHYKIVGEKNKDKIYLDFYQSSTLIAKVPAIETESDFDETAINFVKLVPYNEQRVKIIYGSMDFNAYTFIKIKNEISDKN